MAARVAGHRESMLLLRLPFLLIEVLLRRLFGRGEHEQRFAPTASPVAQRTTVSASAVDVTPSPSDVDVDGASWSPPPPTADEAIERRVAREAAEAAAQEVNEPTPLRPIGDDGHLDDDEALVESFGPADDVGAAITVDEPWEGYAQQSATAIVARLRGADPATKAVVALYEGAHKRRATILRAAD